jgi:protein arginine N-methyltransferase 1
MITSRPHDYSLAGHGHMIADSVRREAYTNALRQVIRPGCVVLDIGTGTGFFALVACRLGASRVYAVEPSEIIQVARELAVHNGFADRITFFQDVSTRVVLPERVDVVVSDLRGILPLFGEHLPALADARRRLLAEGGVVIPRRDRMWASVVEAEELYSSLTAVWERRPEGIDLLPVRRIVISSYYKGYFTAGHLLVEPGHWITLNYDTENETNFAGELTWTASRPGTAHGLVVWFDTDLVEGVSFSNAPSAPRALYGQCFFPLPAPVPIEIGDTIAIRLQARLVGTEYVWRWDTTIRSAGQLAQLKACHRQTTFQGLIASPEKLKRRTADFVPVLDEEGHIDRLIVSLFDGCHSLAEIARRVSAEFPGPFPTWQEALSRVGDLSERYSDTTPAQRSPCS